MRLMWIIVISLVYCSSGADRRQPSSSSTSTRRPARTRAYGPSVMWAGVLIFQNTSTSQEYITGITLIKTRLALGNADDVAHIPKTNIRNTTKAIFLLRQGVVRSAQVIDYALHPEFNVDTLNTIALVKLVRDDERFNWELVYWPKKGEQMTQHIGNVYAIEYTNLNDELEQVMHAMEYVDLAECKMFIQEAQLDAKWLTPAQYQCYKKKSSRKPCVWESGVPLAVYRGGKWKLLGISVQGPGCALPGRFIDFARYVPWVLRWIEEDALARMSLAARAKTRPGGYIYDKVVIEGAQVEINSHRILRSV